MARPEEIAEIEVAGKKYRDWLTVEVSRSMDNFAATMFALGVAEENKQIGQWAALKLKPGDGCDIRLAGLSALKGFINARQAGYNAVQHALTVSGRSKLGDVVDSSVVAKGGQFRGYSYDAIVRSVLKPYGIDFEMRSKPEGDAKMANVSPQYGETAWQFIERLTRIQNLHLMENAEGKLIAFRQESDAPVAQLEEGRNIKAAQATIRDDTLFDAVTAVQQGKGSDNAFGESVRDVAAEAKNAMVQRYRPNRFLAEEPGTKDDMKRRAQREVDEQIGTAVQCQVTIQGWLKDDGTLWLNEVGNTVVVRSPMLFPTPHGEQKLGVYAVSCRQSSEAGTETTISLVLPQALGYKGTPNPEGSGGNPFTTIPSGPQVAV